MVSTEDELEIEVFEELETFTDELETVVFEELEAFTDELETLTEELENFTDELENFTDELENFTDELEIFVFEELETSDDEAFCTELIPSSFLGLVLLLLQAIKLRTILVIEAIPKMRLNMCSPYINLYGKYRNIDIQNPAFLADFLYLVYAFSSIYSFSHIFCSACNGCGRFHKNV
jgi:hypothetical protein